MLLRSVLCSLIASHQHPTDHSFARIHFSSIALHCTELHLTALPYIALKTEELGPPLPSPFYRHMTHREDPRMFTGEPGLFIQPVSFPDISHGSSDVCAGQAV
jgi:hypothetical protein